MKQSEIVKQLTSEIVKCLDKEINNIVLNLIIIDFLLDNNYEIRVKDE